MVKIIPESKELIIGEEYLYTIMFGLKDVLKIYQKEIEEYNKIEYSKMSCEQIHLMGYFENKVFDTQKVLLEIDNEIERMAGVNEKESYEKVDS
jgi:hypothetical protein